MKPYDFDETWEEFEAAEGCGGIGLTTEHKEAIRFALRFTKAALGEPSDAVIEAGECYFDQNQDVSGFKAMIAQLCEETEIG